MRNIKKLFFIFAVFLLVLFGFSLSNPKREDISYLIENKFENEIKLNSITPNPVNKIGVKIDDVIIKSKDKLFEKLMQLVG